jgi:peptidoglycan/LPS O-acetylase OafA/YrhL
MEKRACWAVGAAAVLGLVMIQLGGVPVLAAALLVLAVRYRSSKAWAARPMNAAWLRYVGRISYGVYLYYFPVCVLMGTEEGGVGRRAGAVAVTFAVAALSHVAVETPLLALKKRFSSKGEAPKPARRGGLATHS